jgi:hypothetical protein
LMAKGEGMVDSSKGELLFTETIPKKLQPRKVLKGKRWSLLENLGRVAGVALLGYLIYLLATTDLSVTENVLNIAVGAVAVVLLFYVTEVISPRGRRMSYPVKVYTKGLEVHTSALETLRGMPPFLPKKMIAKMVVRRISVNIDGKQDLMPTNLKLVLINGRTLDLGMRNYYELERIIVLLRDRLGVIE